MNKNISLVVASILVASLSITGCKKSSTTYYEDSSSLENKPGDTISSSVSSSSSSEISSKGGVSSESSSSQNSLPIANNSLYIFDIGSDFACGNIEKNGEISCWGSNNNGKLGIDNTSNSYNTNEPEKISNDLGFKEISLSAEIGCGIESTTNYLKCWGAIGENKREDSPILISSEKYENIVIKGNQVYAKILGNSNWNQIDLINYSIINTLQNYSNISGGETTACGYNNYNEQWECWLPGTTYYTNYKFDKVIGSSHMCGIESDTNKVLCWGDSNNEGELGYIDKDAVLSVPHYIDSDKEYDDIVIVNKTTFAKIKDTNNWEAWGNNTVYQFGIPENKTNSNIPTTSVQGYNMIVGSTGNTVCGVKASNGNMTCWGSLKNGVLGLMDTIEGANTLNSASYNSSSFSVFSSSNTSFCPGILPCAPGRY